MRFFSYFDGQELDTLFYQKPVSFTKHSDREMLSYALGATLYMPGTRQNLAHDIASQKIEGLTSIVIDLEDAVGDGNLQLAEQNLIEQIGKLSHLIDIGQFSIESKPLLFIRIRHIEQFKRIKNELGQRFQIFTGVVLPKFDAETGRELLEEVQQIDSANHPFYAMPILETAKVIQKENRMSELMSIKGLLDEFHENILNIRIGATDFSGLYGIRRNADTTVYEIAVLRDCISDIINVFLRADSPYVISGPVWEYFSSKERMMKPQLRQTPFRESFGQEGIKWRSELLDRHLDGLIREVLMDISNGLTGKTVIHPSHVKAVQAMNVVSYEEYIDARNILSSLEGENGAVKSPFSNKMNEIKPHAYWAAKTILKSKIYGVLNAEFTNIDLLGTKVYV